VDHQHIRILLIEDDLADFILLRKKLTSSHEAAVSNYHLESVTALQQGLDRLAKGDIDVVLLDLHLPDSNGVATVERIREQDPQIPIVVLTAVGDEEIAVRALQAGAQDYLVKDELSGPLLRRAIRYAIERRRIAEEKERFKQQLVDSEKL